MRRWIRAVVILGFVIIGSAFVLPTLAHAEQFERHPRVEALPILGRIEGGPTVIIVRGELPRKRARRMVSLARAVYEDVNNRLIGSRDHRAEHPVDLCLFRTTREYLDFVTDVYGDDDHSINGFYVYSKRLAVANLSRSVGNLRHELVHPLVGDDFRRIPAWLNEGLGSLYGTATRIRSKKRKFRFLVNYRLRHFRAARKRGALPTLEDLATSTSNEVRGDNAATYYAMGRYLLLYLDKQGTLGEFYRAMRAERPTKARQLELLNRYVDYDKFLAWAKRLKLKRRRK